MVSRFDRFLPWRFHRASRDLVLGELDRMRAILESLQRDNQQQRSDIKLLSEPLIELKKEVLAQISFGLYDLTQTFTNSINTVSDERWPSIEKQYLQLT